MNLVRRQFAFSQRAALLGAAITCAILASEPPVLAQTFPDHIIKLVVPFPAGGPTDTIARVVTQNISAYLGQSMIVENLPGAGGRLGTKAVARAGPDGYTLLLGGTNTNAVTPALYTNLGFDPVKDFDPVAAVATDSWVLVVHPSVPAQTMAELVRYAREHPGELMSGATIGISPHVFLELFRVRTATNILFVPYKGAAPSIVDILGGHIQITESAKSVLLPLIKSGKLRALAVTSAERWPELPEVPTMRESGFEGFPEENWFGLVAPRGTPGDVIAKLNSAVNARLETPEAKAAFANLGLNARSLSPQEFGAVLADEVRLWQAVVHETGIKME
jgi:tripartite-type tricarboxylate transporter receptor subunit TctC